MLIRSGARYAVSIRCYYIRQEAIYVPRSKNLRPQPTSQQACLRYVCMYYLSCRFSIFLGVGFVQTEWQWKDSFLLYRRLNSYICRRNYGTWWKMIHFSHQLLEVCRCCRLNEDCCRCWYSSRLLLLLLVVVVVVVVVVASGPPDDLLCLALAWRGEDFLTRPWRTRVSVPSKFLFMDFSIATMESISSCSSAMTTDGPCSSMFTFGWVVLWC